MEAVTLAGVWDRMLQAWPYSPQALFAVGFSVLLEVTTIVVSLIFVVLERCRLCQRWRVHTNPEISSPPAELVQEALRDHLVSGLVLRPLITFFTFPIFTWCGMETSTETLPTLTQVCIHVFLCMLIDDTWFYWTHRALHHRWFYSRIHKQHHRFRFTHVLASEFAHPVEDLSNSFGTMLGPLILGSHMSVAWLYGVIKLAQVRTAPMCDSSGKIVCFSLSHLHWRVVLTMHVCCSVLCAARLHAIVFVCSMDLLESALHRLADDRVTQWLRCTISTVTVEPAVRARWRARPPRIPPFEKRRELWRIL